MPKGPIFHILTMENQPFQMIILPFAYHTVIRERFTDPVEMRTECAHDIPPGNKWNVSQFPPTPEVHSNTGKKERIERERNG